MRSKPTKTLTAKNASHYLESLVAFFQHPSRVLVGDEGDLAMRVEDGKILVRKRGVALRDASFDDLLELPAAPLAALLEDEKLTARSAQQALDDISGNEGLVGTEVLLWAHLLGTGEVSLGVHLQPSLLNQILASPRARQFADRRILPSEICTLGPSMVLAPYSDPGLPNARELKKKVMLWRDRHKEVPGVILIQNNGVILLGNSTGELIIRMEALLRSAEIFFGSSVLGGPVFLTPTNVDRLTDQEAAEVEEERAETA